MAASIRPIKNWVALSWRSPSATRSLIVPKRERSMSTTSCCRMIAPSYCISFTRKAPAWP